MKQNNSFDFKNVTVSAKNETEYLAQTPEVKDEHKSTQQLKDF